MSGINPVSGMVPPVRANPAPASPAAARQAPADQANFSQMLTRCIDRVDADQASSAEAVRQLLSGQAADPLGVVTAMAKADMSFKLLIGVRNKVIEAYKQTMNMQI
ncbi:MAG TPA: flagellar hook-basal body complex protein FliE [Phycisphaerae bacterium]|nr:flagellar hook-basal body complex protein FliE [Phycisphaerae bacterium]